MMYLAKCDNQGDLIATGVHCIYQTSGSFGQFDAQRV